MVGNDNPAAWAGWGERFFGSVDLNDKRRNRRLIRIMDRFAAHPAGTLPSKLPPAELKACYRLCDCEHFTHAALLAGVREFTMKRIEAEPGPILLIHDTTELDYTSLKSVAGELGPIGNGGGRGWLCHNTLALTGDGRVIGLVNQILHRREPVPKGELTAAKRRRLSRESRLWPAGTEGLPADPRLIDVADRGADTFEFLAAERASGRGFVIRSSHDRNVLIDGAPGGKSRLHEHMRTLPSTGTRTLKLAAKPGRPRRTVALDVSFAAVRLVAPHVRRGEHAREPLSMWCVRLWEPDGDLERFLLCGRPVDTFEQAAEAAGWYEKRWTIEDFHKSMKTGCGVETLQFTTADRLEPMIMILSATASLMLMLRGLASDPAHAERPATDILPVGHVGVLSVWRHRKKRALTIREFLLALGRLGGHQNRKSDGPPGWITLWRGWLQLDAMLQYAAASGERCGET